MTPQDLLSTLSEFTKDQWIQFEEIRRKAFEPTVEQKEQIEDFRKEQIFEKVKSILAQYNIFFSGKETDFSALWHLYILGDESKDNPDMQEWLGDTHRLQEIVAEKIAKENNFDAFCNFVLSYEA